jgi:hypothetical protein
MYIIVHLVILDHIYEHKQLIVQTILIKKIT